MEFVEDEARPRFLFRGGGGAPSAFDRDAGTQKVHKIHAAACLSTASLLLVAAVSLSHSPALSSLLAWISLSLILAPFAPHSATGGDPRVGCGPLLPDPPAAQTAPSDPDEPRKRNLTRRPRSQPPPPPSSGPSSSPFVSGPPISKKPEERSGDRNPNGSGSAKEVEGEKEWTDDDFELLKRQILKHPVGAPRRWERIAEAFRGRHGLNSVIKTAKSLSERKPASGESFQQFLKQRKPLDERVNAIVGDSKDGIPVENGESRKEGGGGSESWSAGEDLALLNALKAFPKDVSMRWEKIAAAVPGKSKACCMKRVAELKRDFRSSKASET